MELRFREYKNKCQQDQNGSVIILEQGIILIDQTRKLLKPGLEYKIEISRITEDLEDFEDTKEVENDI